MQCWSGCIRSSVVGYEMLVNWSGSGGCLVRNVVAQNNHYGFETQPSMAGDELSLRRTNPCLNKKICRQNFILLRNIPLYLPHPFNFLRSWHSQVQGQQWALITSNSYNCVVFIFEYLTRNHTPLSTIYFFTGNDTIIYIFNFRESNYVFC